MAKLRSKARPSSHRSVYYCHFKDSSSSPSVCFTDSKSLCFHTSVHTHPHSHSVHSAISVPSTSSVWMMPSRLFPLLTAFTQQLWSPSVKCVSVPSSTNSPCRCQERKKADKERNRLVPYVQLWWRSICSYLEGVKGVWPIEDVVCKVLFIQLLISIFLATTF